MTDFLDEKRQQIADRLKELEPLVDEHNRLEAAASALAKLGASAPAAAAAAATTTPAATPRRRPGRPRGSTNRASKATPAATSAPAMAVARREKPGRPKGRVGRHNGSGTRAAQALAAVQGRPGITIPELATEMGMQTTYLYRVLPGLVQDGKVVKKGRGWYPKAE